MTKRKKLKEIYKFCKTKYLDYKKVTKNDLFLIMEFIDKKETNKLIDEQNDDYNGLLKGDYRL